MVENPDQLMRDLLAERDELLTPAEVARVFKVDAKTVTRWAAAGRLPSIRTPGGHRRFKHSDVRALFRANQDGGPNGR